MDFLDRIRPGFMPKVEYDTSETINISSLALLKMLKHARAGVPMEVLGLMLGEVIDDYTISVVDVFAMPQSGSGVSVESVDHAYQAQMMDMLNRAKRPEQVVGWYHSHPGFGCWLSSTDMRTQLDFESLGERVFALVIDPIQSVRGKVIIDAFRLVNPMMAIQNKEARQTTSNVGSLNKPSAKAVVQGLNRHYYSININFQMREMEQMMLQKVHSKHWTETLSVGSFVKRVESNKESLSSLSQLAKGYHKALEDEEKMSKKDLQLKMVGRQDPKRHVEETVERMMVENVTHTVRTLLNTVIFK